MHAFVCLFVCLVEEAAGGREVACSSLGGGLNATEKSDFLPAVCVQKVKIQILW